MNINPFFKAAAIGLPLGILTSYEIDEHLSDVKMLKPGLAMIGLSSLAAGTFGYVSARSEGMAASRRAPFAVAAGLGASFVAGEILHDRDSYPFGLTYPV